MCYMGDQATHLAFNELATDIVGLGVDTPDLRDEIYCLILKQMNGNMNPASCLRGWELLAFCTGCFAPSADLLPYVSAFLTKCTGPKSTARERKFAEVCCTRLAKIASVGPRKRPPSVSEMEAIKMHRKVNVTIFLPTGKTMVLRVESTTTASAMCKRMCKKLHLDSNAKWAFFETYNELERKLQPKEFMLDIVYKWELYVRLMEGTDSESCRFVFKRVHVGDRCECASRSDSRFVYDQAVAEVMSGHQPVTEIEAVRLAALSFEHDLRSGVPAPADWAKAYIPPELIQYRKSQEWLDVITNELEKVRASVDKKATAMALENQYMEYVSSLPMYGSSIFYVALKASSHEYLPTSFYVCVNLNGIHFISTDMVLHTIPFSQFVCVNLEGHTLSIVSTKDAQDGEEKKPKKETFRLLTYQGDDIRAAIDNVVATLNPKLKKTKSATTTTKTLATPAKTSTLQKAATTSNVGKTATVTNSGLQKAASTTTKKTTTTKKLKSENKLVSVLSV